MWVRSAKEVQRIQSQANLVTGNSNQEDIIEQLKTFQQTLLAQEQSFYSSVGLSGAEQFKANYSTAYAEINGKQNNLLAVENVLVERYRNGGPLNRDQIVDQFIKRANQLIEDDPELHRRLVDFSATGVDLVLEALARKNSNIHFSSQTSRRRGGGLHAQKVGIGTLNLKISQDRKKIVQKVKVDNDLISDSFLKKLNEYLNGPQGQEKLQKAIFLDEVREELTKYGLSNLIPLLNKAGNVLDVNQSEASIRGFFGELYALSLLSTLFSEKATQVFSTGTIRKASSGQQIPIDFALQNALGQFHFQVKNYNTAKGSITLKGHMSAPNFLENKMLITGQPLDILIEFLASYQYNQPFESDGLKQLYANTEMPVEKYASDVYSQFQNVFSKMRYMFDQYAPNLFKIEDLFKAKSGGLFNEEKQYINNFFIVKNRIVPASEIIQQLIDAFDKRPITSYRLAPPSNKEDTLEGNFNTYEHRPDENLLARLVNINYSITIAI